MDQAETIDASDPRLRRQELATAAGQMPLTLISSGFHAAIVLALFRAQPSVAWGQAWAWALAVASAILVWFAARMRTRHGDLGHLRASGHVLMAGALALGTTWGCAGLIFFPEEGALERLLLGLLLSGVAATGAIGTAAHFPAMLAFLLPALSPLIVRLTAAWDPLHAGVAAVVATSATAAAWLAARNARALAEAQRARLQHADLLAQILHAKVHLEASNEQLQRRIVEQVQHSRRTLSAVGPIRRGTTPPAGTAVAHPLGVVATLRKQLARVATVEFKAQTPTRARASLAILIVDDHEALRKVTVEMLRSLGHRPTAVADVDEARKLIRQGNLDLLLADIDLAGDVDGLQLAREAASQFPSLRVVLATGHGVEFLSLTPSERRRYPVLAKPFDRAALHAAVAIAQGDRAPTQPPTARSDSPKSGMPWSRTEAPDSAR